MPESAEQLDEVLGCFIVWIEERIGLVEAHDVATVLHHHHDEWPFLGRNVLEFPVVQLRIPREIHGQHVQRQG